MWKPAFKGSPSGRVCAFCKYWYDPGNAAIRPKDLRTNQWEYNFSATSICEISKFKRVSWGRCEKFSPKN